MSANVAIIIVTYNSADCIRPCLDSIFQQPSQLDLQVVVVDNNSPDNTVEIIRDEYPQVELVASSKNQGFAVGVNQGAAQADADFILLLNPDTVVMKGAIDKIVEFATANPENGIYGGQTLQVDGSLEPSSCWAFPTLWSMGMFACGLSTFAPQSRWLNPESMADWKRDTVREVDVVTGCFLLTRSEIWRELKGLDERFFMYGEDIDFAFRAHAAGYRPIICPDAKVVHEVGESSSSKSHKMQLLYRGKATLVRTHWRGFGRMVALWLLLSGTALRAYLARLGRSQRQGGAGQGWQDLWRQRREWIAGY